MQVLRAVLHFDSRVASNYSGSVSTMPARRSASWEQSRRSHTTAKLMLSMCIECKGSGVRLYNGAPERCLDCGGTGRRLTDTERAWLETGKNPCETITELAFDEVDTFVAKMSERQNDTVFTSATRYHLVLLLKRIYEASDEPLELAKRAREKR